MGPVAAGFVILIGTAALVGFLVGAIGGAVVWRARSNLVLGGVLTACAYLLILVVERHGDLHWLRPKLTWGAPALTLAFLICSVSARWLETHTALRPTWTAVAAFGFTVCMGFPYMFSFRISLGLPLLVALVADVCLVLLLVRGRTVPGRTRQR